VGGLLDDIKHMVRQRFDAYMASKATAHVVQREREQLERIDVKLDRFATRIELALLAAEARVESLRRLDDELRTLLAELRQRTGELRITGMDELLELIDSLRNVGTGGAAPGEGDVGSAIKRLAGAPDRGDRPPPPPPPPPPPAPAEAGLHSVRARADAPERQAPPVSFGDVEGWRPDADMRLIEIDVDRDAS
jgi:hypothetical protein